MLDLCNIIALVFLVAAGLRGFFTRARRSIPSPSSLPAVHPPDESPLPWAANIRRDTASAPQQGATLTQGPSPSTRLVAADAILYSRVASFAERGG